MNLCDQIEQAIRAASLVPMVVQTMPYDYGRGCRVAIGGRECRSYHPEFPEPNTESVEAYALAVVSEVMRGCRKVPP
jgi:hypothetical protein